MKRWHMNLNIAVILFCGLFCNSSLFAAEQDELEGVLLIAPNDYSQQEDVRMGAEEDYFISNEDTCIHTEIDLSEVDKKDLRPNDFILVKGVFKGKSTKDELGNFK